MKTVFIVCFCTVLLVHAQGQQGGGQQGGGQQGGGQQGGGTPGRGRPAGRGQGQSFEPLDRAKRQFPQQNGQQPSNNGRGNLGTHGLSNLPDPKTLIAKARELVSQHTRGRSRRELIEWDFDATSD